MEELLQTTSLFSGMEQEEIARLVQCLGNRRRRFRAGETLWRRGDRVEAAGLVLSGAVQAETVTEDGRRELAAHHGPGALFGDVLMAGGGESPVDIVAAEDGEVLFLPFERLMTGCEKRCLCHDRLRRNLLREIAGKYWQQRRHIECLQAPGLREKILCYLRQCAGGESVFAVPLDRQGMADYLAVNRSALCRELGRMKAEGILDYQKNSFRWLS